MANISESETGFQDQAAQILGALPTIGRWLDRSRPAAHLRGSRFDPLSLSQIRILIHIYQCGPQTMGELARALRVSCSTVTECVDGLVARGRVVRTRSRSDRRQVIVSLTPEAEAIASRVLSRRSVVIGKVLLQLSRDENIAFVKGLQLLSREAESWLDQAAPEEDNGSLEKDGPRAQ